MDASGDVKTYYAAVDYIKPSARVFLVGITPSLLRWQMQITRRGALFMPESSILKHSRMLRVSARLLARHYVAI
ncbi:MAG: hypothetical protein OXC80_01985 [Gammaproteobacteria bacterium]|nr:hypothetical protein [Gammaproteobacteria bacterium]